MIRFATERDKDILYELWTLSFGNEEGFASYVFENIFEPELTLVNDEDGVNASLQILNRPLVYRGRVLPSGYIYGACTHPDFRSKGIMRRLMDGAISHMEREGCVFCTLVPQNKGLFDWYSKSGFYPAFALQRELTLASGGGKVRKARDTDLPAVNRHYELGFCGALHPMRSLSLWKLIQTEAEMSGGGLFVLERSGRIVGYAVTHASEDSAVILEQAGEYVSGACALHQVGKKQGYSLRASHIESGTPFASARLINPLLFTEFMGLELPFLDMPTHTEAFELTKVAFSLMDGTSYLNLMHN